MNRIQKYARILQVMSISLGGMLCALPILRWFFFYDFSNESWSSELPLMSLSQRLLGFLVDSVDLGLLCISIVVFYSLMQKFREKEFFSAHVIQLLSNLSKLALGLAIYSPIRLVFLSTITTLHKGPGNRILSLAVGTNDVINIFVFVCFILVTSLMQESVRLQQEQDLTV